MTVSSPFHYLHQGGCVFALFVCLFVCSHVGRILQNSRPRYVRVGLGLWLTHSIIVSPILYALPAWGGFLSAELCNKINAFVSRLKRFGYVSHVITIRELIDTTYEDLFCKTCSA